MEFDVKGFYGSAVGLIFVFMYWKLPMWASVSIKTKIILTVACPVIGFFLASYLINK